MISHGYSPVKSWCLALGATTSRANFLERSRNAFWSSLNSKLNWLLTFDVEIARLVSNLTWWLASLWKGILLNILKEWVEDDQKLVLKLQICTTSKDKNQWTNYDWWRVALKWLEQMSLAKMKWCKRCLLWSSLIRERVRKRCSKRSDGHLQRRDLWASASLASLAWLPVALWTEAFELTGMTFHW